MESTSTTSEGWVMFTCPFAPWTHTSGRDRNPGFGIKSEKGKISGFSCFSCKKTGTMMSLVSQLGEYRQENLNPLYMKVMIEEAVQPPSDFEPLPEPDPEPLVEELYTTLYDCVTKHEEALSYLSTRRISDKTAVLLGLRFDEDEKRILFPIRGRESELFGYTGRDITGMDHRPKVFNYHGVDKRLFLLGEERISNAPIIIVEGLFAYARLFELGVNANACIVASMGSALSDEQATTLIDADNKVYAFYDDDLAGDIGLYGKLNKDGTDHKGGGLVDKLCREIPLYIPTFPEGKDDPDDLTLSEVNHMIRTSEYTQK